MANTLPPVGTCDDNCDCPETTTQTKCYQTREAIPVCASTEGAHELPSDNCTKADPVYDRLIQSFIIPAVGGTSLASVCNASLYTPGAWIQIVNGSAGGAIFQIVAVNTVANQLTLRNACADGVSEIKTNPSPGSAAEANSDFTVTGEPTCTGTDEDVANLQETIALAESLCLDNISQKAVNQEEQRFLGTNIISDCDEGETRPCVRHLLTRETKDGSLKLGNLTSDPSGANSLSPLFADENLKVVTAGTGITDGDTHVGRICQGNLDYIKGGKVMLPKRFQIIFKENLTSKNAEQEVIDLSEELADVPICAGGSAWLVCQGFARFKTNGSRRYIESHVNDTLVFLGAGGDSSDDSMVGGSGLTYIEIPDDFMFDCKIEAFSVDGAPGSWASDDNQWQLIALAVLV